jgi:hypothetical protein
MAKLEFSFACGVYDRMLLQPNGTELKFVPRHGSYGARTMFDCMGGGLEFEASKMSSAEFICLHVRGRGLVS